jgi:hypothetical protein
MPLLVLTGKTQHMFQKLRRIDTSEDRTGLNRVRSLLRSK